MDEQQILNATLMEYTGLDKETKSEIDWWVQEYIRPAKAANPNHTSYGLKHLFHSVTKIYVTNGQFKGAMLENGYYPVDPKELNWLYEIENVRMPGRHQPEAVLEKRFSREINKRNGLALKFISPGWAGAPDRIVLLPGGSTVFVELKAYGKKPEPLQIKRHQELEKLSFPVRIIDSEAELQAFLEEFFPYDF